MYIRETDCFCSKFFLVVFSYHLVILVVPSVVLHDGFPLSLSSIVVISSLLLAFHNILHQFVFIETSNIARTLNYAVQKDNYTRKMATVSLKLLVDNSTKKVIFAEAEKDFVDFLFGLLEIPLGSLLRLLAIHGMWESWTLSKVYESVVKLDNEYLQPDQTKNSLLDPVMSSSNTKGAPLMQQLGYRTSQPPSYSNYYGSSYQSNVPKEVDGYVKGSVTYMISDDLSVKPVSSISSISLINSLSVKDIATPEEKIVNIDMQKALELVRTSFGSNTVLTDVFVGKAAKKF